ncbi:MAG: amidohydrolase family protein [Acidobacteria bacterium]|nr:amidohydrolase family protein [Acidobacteriota bacterium]
MKRRVCQAITLSLFVLFPVLPLVRGQAEQSSIIVIEGATLIDGNGGPPVPGSRIIIRGNRIETVTRKGEGSNPAGAQVINADGKFIVPGLMDAHVHYNEEHLPELFLNHGVTSVFEIGGGEEWALVQKKAIERGKIPGPRLFVAVGSMAGGRIAALGGVTAAAGPLSSRQVVMTPDKAREVAKRFIDAGADMIKVHRGPPPEAYQAAAEEAHKAGLPVVAQPLGPTVYAREAVLAGADILEHAAGVGYSIAKDPAKWKGWGDMEEHSLDPSIFADMDDAKAAELIQLLLQRRVYLEPDFVCQGRGLQKRRNEYELQDYRLLELPELSYIPERTRLKWLDNYTEFDDEPGVRQLREKGFHNMQKFTAQFVRAGGKILAGTDASGNGWAVAGIGLHHELDILVFEVGLTPMQAIVASTRNVAEAFRLLDRLGTIEQGKLADLVIVSEDPLKDIRNLMKIDRVMKDGRIIDRTYHPSFTNPLPNLAVEGPTWVAALKKETESMRTTSFGQLSPGIESVSPKIVTEGSPTLTLTINGVGFTKRSKVTFGGEPVPATLVSATELKAIIDASRLVRPGTFPITVTNPEPLQRPQWGGTSNRAYLLVNFKE